MTWKLKRFEPTEFTEQTIVMDWARLHQERCHRLKLLYCSLAGVRLPIGLAVKAKRAGNKPGIPDLFLPVARYREMITGLGGAPMGVTMGVGLIYHGLYIELKRRKSGVESEEQKWWREHLTAQGYRVEVCHGADEAIKVLCEYLEYKPSTDCCKPIAVTSGSDST